jgi:predicted MPP superfamily phosphohydrolase
VLLKPRRVIAVLVLSVAVVLLMLGLGMRFTRFAMMVPVGAADWIRVSSFLTLIVSCVSGMIACVWRLIPRPTARHSPERRRFLAAARTAVVASPVIATGYGVFIQRDNFQLREVDIPVPGLHPDLHGLRMVQVSDIHLSPFLSEKELARTIDMANGTRAHLALVTGDLITTSRDPLDRCIQQLARLKADAGVIGCLGNHEAYALAEDYTTEQAGRVGIQFLRDESRVLFFNGRPINFTGVDYQSAHREYLVGTQRHVRAGMPNILLSHNPDVFPKAAAQGFDVTVSGHTHGGQITFEILHQNVSIARFYTPYVYGHYRQGDASIYVTRGIGTVGVPARLGAPPEVTLIRLCAT